MKTASTVAPERLYEDLKRQHPPAIRLLASQLAPALSRLPGAYLLPKSDMEELTSDAVLVSLQKIAAGEFQFQSASPITYAVAVGRKLLANRLRKKRLDTQSLDGWDAAAADFDPQKFLENKEQELALGKVLAQMSDGCREIIRLFYFDQLRDEEVVAGKLSRYTSVDSLKTKRSQCLKKLGEMVRKVWEA